MNEKKERGSWDEYFMLMAKNVLSRSFCPHRFGAVIVKNNIPISMGYNGSPRGVKDCGKDGTCPKRAKYGSGEQGLHICNAVHAEANTIIFGGGLKGCEDATLYLYGDVLPCKSCAGMIIQAGIKEVVCLDIKEYPRLDDGIDVSVMFKEAGIKIRVPDYLIKKEIE